MKSTGQNNGQPSSGNFSALKTEQRRNFRAKAAEHATQEATLSAHVGRNVTGYLRADPIDKSKHWLGCFQALPGEPNLESIFSELKADGFKLAFPTITGDDLRFFEVETQDDWQQGPWGIREPSPERAKHVGVDDIGALLIPGLAFDKKGGRLGRGKGFYDRTLQNFKGTKIGVTFAYAVAPELPCESHDVRMDLIITEAGVHFARERVL